MVIYKLIYRSGVNPRDLYCIFEYLSGTIFPKMLQSDLQGGSVSRNFTLSQRGNFLTGGSGQDAVKPPRVFIYSTEDTSRKSPKMYLYDSEGGSTGRSGYFLVIYRAFGAIICLFVDGMTFQLSLSSRNCSILIFRLHNSLGGSLR